MFKIIKTGEYELMKKMVLRQDNYIENIKLLNQKVEDIENTCKYLYDRQEKTEQARRKNASSIGGLRKSLNTQKDKNKELEEELLEKTQELNLAQAKIKMLEESKKRHKNVECYKNYFEARHECERREK